MDATAGFGPFGNRGRGAWNKSGRSARARGVQFASCGVPTISAATVRAARLPEARSGLNREASMRL